MTRIDELGHPTPWRVDKTLGMIVDADGELVATSTTKVKVKEIAILTVICDLANQAAGVRRLREAAREHIKATAEVKCVCRGTVANLIAAVDALDND